MNQIINIFHYESPIGLLRIGCSNHGLHELFFVQSYGFSKRIENLNNRSCLQYIEQFIEMHNKVIIQINEYFSGNRFVFDLPLLTHGTSYQTKVWNHLQAIPYANTISYQDLAKRVISEKHCRSVANANSCNPISIIIPCHRVIQSNGSLGGYAGDIWRKDWLLKHETQNNSILQI